MFVHRAAEGRRYVVTIFAFGTGCIATGATWEEANGKADQWMTDNLKRLGVLGKIGILDLELGKLCSALASRSTSAG